MAKSKKRKIFSDYSDFTIFVVVLLIVTLGVVSWLFVTMSSTIKNHRTLEAQNNQACMGISAAKTSGFDVDVSTLYATANLKEVSGQGEVANQKCIVAGSSKAENSKGKTIDSYNFGADVAYFQSAEDAKKYADESINPLRNWEADSSKTYYTVLVDSGSAKYFDAYTVSKNAVLRISLPCDNDSQDAEQSSKTCQAKVDRTIAVFGKKLSPLSL